VFTSFALGAWAFRKNDQNFFGPTISSILGLASDAPTFENFISTVHPEDLPQFLSSPTGVTIGRWPNQQGPGQITATFDFRVIAGGSIRFIRGRARITSGFGGATEEVSGFVEDVTDLKLAERERFATLEKLTHLGQMASAVIHEINTPLTVISFYAQALEKETQSAAPDLAKVHQHAAQITRITLKMSKMIKSMRYYMAPRVNREFEVCALAAVYDEVESLCREKLRHDGVTVTADIPGSLSLECRPVQLCQVLTNLLVNAVESIRHLPERWIRVEAAADANQLVIKVIDSGFGIPREIARSIMVPFFTTREEEGTGLGLPLCKEIVDQHHGRISYDETAPRTTFVIKLPLRQPASR
jgi:signal transduction histidine kinase